jgi:hypothetical protein
MVNTIFPLDSQEERQRFRGKAVGLTQAPPTSTSRNLASRLPRTTSIPAPGNGGKGRRRRTKVEVVKVEVVGAGAGPEVLKVHPQAVHKAALHP